MADINQLQQMRQYFNSGITRPYAYRKQQLLAFKAAVIKYEEEIYNALYSDLKKIKEESWFTENGLLLQEINHTLKHLKQWMQPELLPTNLANFPSKSYSIPGPLGVVLVVGPWNFPLMLSLVPLAGAIAAGNCVVLKPSELAPASTAIVKKIVEESLPPQLAVVTEGEGALVIPQMMEHFRFDHVFFTGSIAVGKAIYQLAAKDLVPVTLELGGKDPCVVEADADLRVAARRIVLAKFSNAGQMCVSPDYLLVHRDVKDKLVGLLKEYIIKFYGEQPAETYGYNKIINEKRFDTLVSYLQQGTILYGGQYDKAALFIAPTLLDEVSINAPVMQEEIFGPVLPVFSFSSSEEALEIINRNPNPLSFYVFTGSKKKEAQWLQQVQFGAGCINNAALQFTNHYLPFGGVGQSGTGAYHGKKTFDVFSHKKSVMKTPAWFDPALKYPPLKGKLKLLKFLIK